MGFAIAAFFAVFLMVASGGLLLFYREATLERIHEVIHPRPKPKGLGEAFRRSRFSIAHMVQRLDHLLPKSQAEISVVSQRLTRAGFRDESAVKIFYGAKVLVPLLFSAVALATGLSRLSPFFVYVGCLGIGFLVPDFWLAKRIARRQQKIRRGLPDVVDLLVICIEAGLSLDHATARTVEELGQAQPDLCDELGIVVLEQHAGRPRSEAWKNMADRTDENSVRNMVSMLIQSEQLGTSLARTLRVHAESLRTQRVQQVEEMAAKTSVKLVFPLVLFIFPSMFLVTLGPAVILMMESFKTLLKH